MEERLAAVCRGFDSELFATFTDLDASTRLTGSWALSPAMGDSGLEEVSVSVSKLSGSAPNRLCHHSTT